MTHPEVYAPAEDTWLLLRAAGKECRDGERVLEIGCGSGAVSGALRHRARILATDISPYAVKAARAFGVEVVRTDLFSVRTWRLEDYRAAIGGLLEKGTSNLVKVAFDFR